MLELGGVLGIAVLASVFARQGAYDSPQALIDGFTQALWLGVGLSASAPPVTHKSALKKRVHSTLINFGGPCPVSDLFGPRAAACSPDSTFRSPGEATSRRRSS